MQQYVGGCVKGPSVAVIVYKLVENEKYFKVGVTAFTLVRTSYPEQML